MLELQELQILLNDNFSWSSAPIFFQSIEFSMSAILLIYHEGFLHIIYLG